MLYQIYDTQRALMEPFADLAQATAKALSNPLTPMGNSPMAHRLAAGYELLYRLGKDYEKPEFNLRSIMIGETEKQVASSKLSALISLLEKDRDSQPRSAIPSRSHVMNSASPAKEEEEVVKVIIYEEEVKKPEILGTSPANFSFLKGGVTIKKSSDSTESGPSMARSLKVKSDSKLMASPLALERSHSTSTLNEIKSAHSKMMNESPESLNKSFDKTSSGSSEGEAKEAGEDNKAKYRRCSSLKSGKTPPGTPARHKVVR